VIVGKVVAADGSGTFRLRIDYVLRGPRAWAQCGPSPSSGRTGPEASARS
jgi:hypothetical protein